jgi:hypothetical protein
VTTIIQDERKVYTHNFKTRLLRQSVETALYLSTTSVAADQKGWTLNRAILAVLWRIPSRHPAGVGDGQVHILLARFCSSAPTASA